jgi:hypothetical protein
LDGTNGCVADINGCTDGTNGCVADINGCTDVTNGCVGDGNCNMISELSNDKFKIFKLLHVILLCKRFASLINHSPIMEFACVESCCPIIDERSSIGISSVVKLSLILSID